MIDQKTMREMVFDKLVHHSIIGHESIVDMTVRVEPRKFTVSLAIGNGYRVIGGDGSAFHACCFPREYNESYDIGETLDHMLAGLTKALRLEDEDLERGIQQYPIARVKAHSGNTIELQNPDDIVNFAVGVRYLVSANDGSGKADALRDDVLLVTAVSYTDGILTVRDSAPSLSDNDYLFPIVE